MDGFDLGLQAEGEINGVLPRHVAVGRAIHAEKNVFDHGVTSFLDSRNDGVPGGVWQEGKKVEGG